MINYILFFIGITIIMISFILLKKTIHVESLNALRILENHNSKIKENIDTAQEIIKELNDLSERIIVDLDSKVKDAYHRIEDLDRKAKEQSILEHKNDAEDIKNSSENIDIGLEEKKKNLQYANTAIKNDPSVEQVLQLFTQGYSSSQIAKHLNKGIGEVQLIHNLKKR
ncbi:hypothetical protein QBE52_09340 [Clostridiaceae bacterium 35-E11]